MREAQCVLKARKGIIRVKLRISSGKIEEASITGDFMVYPEDSILKLEDIIRGVKVVELEDKLKEYFGRENIIFLGSSSTDFIEAFKCAARKAAGDPNG